MYFRAKNIQHCQAHEQRSMIESKKAIPITAISINNSMRAQNEQRNRAQAEIDNRPFL